jgi:hypothetical protein
MEAHPEVDGIVSAHTSRYGCHEDLVVFVARPGPGPSNEEWHAYVRWLRRIMDDKQGMRVLVLARGKGPSAEQRSYANAELGGERVRMAVLLEDPLLLPVVKVFSWFVRSLRVFAPTEVNEALGYLGVDRSEGIDALLTELGVPLP